MWAVWWVWMIGALALGILEVFVPGYIFLGFAAGAAITGITIGVGGPLAAWLSGSIPMTILYFAVMSLIAWLAFRKFAGVRAGQAKLFDRDINED